MAKIDDQMAELTAGFQDPEWRAGTAWIPDEQMEALRMRRKKSGQPQHLLTYLIIGERGAPTPATFWGHKFSDCIKAAQTWRGLPTVNKRGPRKAAPAGA